MAFACIVTHGRESWGNTHSARRELLSGRKTCHHGGNCHDSHCGDHGENVDWKDGLGRVGWWRWIVEEGKKQLMFNQEINLSANTRK